MPVAKESDKENYTWYIARIAYRNELKVKDLLDISGINYYMPFRKVFRTWKGVRKEFHIPLFPSCVFIQIEESELAMLYMMREISLFVGKEGRPVCLSEDQMNEIIKELDNSDDTGEVVLRRLSDC